MVRKALYAVFLLRPTNKIDPAINTIITVALMCGSNSNINAIAPTDNKYGTKPVQNFFIFSGFFAIVADIKIIRAIFIISDGWNLKPAILSQRVASFTVTPTPWN